MNFFKRKFSYGDDEEGVALDDPGSLAPAPVGQYSRPTSAQSNQPPSAFSFAGIASKVSSTISAPTSPCRTSESLATALERSLQADRARAPPTMHPDARVLLVIDSQYVDWSKYFRVTGDLMIRVEQADFSELDIMCTEYTCTVETSQSGRDTRQFTPHCAFIGPGAERGAASRRVIRALIAARVPFLNSHSSMEAFLDKANLKKDLRKVTLSDGSRLPFLPTIHYPNFKKFHATCSYPIVVSVRDGGRGKGKMKINSAEELLDCEGMLQLVGKEPLEVEVEPFIDTKYDMHVQRIGGEYKTFIRRSIGRHWKSNVGSAVLEQITTNDRHKSFLDAISEQCGAMSVVSIDILVSREGREFIHAVNDVVSFYGESQEEDRRAIAHLLRMLATSKKMSLDSNTSERSCISASTSNSTLNGLGDLTGTSTPVRTNGKGWQSGTSTPSRLPKEHKLSNGGGAPMPSAMSQSHVQPSEQTRQPPRPPRAYSIETEPPVAPNFADDTMGQLKRTFAGIFGETHT